MHSTADQNIINYTANSFLGLRTTGIFAPASYWRSSEDWGIGDIDTLFSVIDYARNMNQSVIQLLPLNLPSADNCPYAIASNYIFDKVYIGLKSLLKFVGADGAAEYDKAMALFEKKKAAVAALRKNTLSTNEQTRLHKQELLLIIFDAFIRRELDGKTENIFLAIKSEPTSSLDEKSALAVKFINYCKKNKWLCDHLLFFCLSRKYKTDDFRKWPDDIARRESEAIKSAVAEFKKDIIFESFCQWILSEQLSDLLHYAKNGTKSIDIMLDQPFAFGNADVWANLSAFIIDPVSLKRELTQGAPPHRLDIPQHWQFSLPDFSNPHAKELLLSRLLFLLQYCTLLRIDHLLGYYQLYTITEDTKWEMTLSGMNIWDSIASIINGDFTVKDKRNLIYSIIEKGINKNFPKSMTSKLFDKEGKLRHGNAILAARKIFKAGDYERDRCGWYEVSSAEFSHKIIFSLLSHNEYGEDYLEKLISEEKFFLRPDDSIRIAFFNHGPGEEIVSEFMHLAQLQGKELVFENLGLVPPKVAQSMKELGTREFKPLYFGYLHFTGDSSPYWVDNISEQDYCSFSIHDTVTIESWWTGLGKWSEDKYYFKTAEQKVRVIEWLKEKKYLDENDRYDLAVLTDEMHIAVLKSVADSKASIVVYMMPDLFKSGEEGIINIPGQSGFWTVRAPETIEELTAQTFSNSEHTVNKKIRILSAIKNRDSFKDQIQHLSKDETHLLATHPLCGSGSKSIRFLNDKFLIDAVIYGKVMSADVVLNGNDCISMTELIMNNKVNEDIHIYRTKIHVTEKMIGTTSFQIRINGAIRSDCGYLIGLMPHTDTNPLSETYGKISNTEGITNG